MLWVRTCATVGGRLCDQLERTADYRALQRTRTCLHARTRTRWSHEDRARRNGAAPQPPDACVSCYICAARRTHRVTPPGVYVCSAAAPPAPEDRHRILFELITSETPAPQPGRPVRNNALATHRQPWRTAFIVLHATPTWRTTSTWLGTVPSSVSSAQPYARGLPQPQPQARQVRSERGSRRGGREEFGEGVGKHTSAGRAKRIRQTN
jgi:hypothetical protein